jgi:glycosyltransferase involved in cell wall biosynthesis
VPKVTLRGDTAVVTRVSPAVTARAPRVAYVTSTRGIAGAEELLVALVDGGRARGWEQTVLNPFGNAGSAALAERCAPVAFETRGCAGPAGLPRLRSWLAQRLGDVRPDIVHVSLFQATALTATIPRGGERRLLTHVYGEGLAQLTLPRVRQRLDRWACARYDHVSAISDAVGDFLVQTHGVRPPPVGRIRLGWSGDPAPPRPSAGRPPTVVCVAALRPEKGHDTLLAAFVTVLGVIPEARLVLVGDGPERGAIEATIAAAGMTASVDLRGRVAEVWPHLADADVFVLASPAEALGIAIMEAMAAGLPVVATDVGGIPELVTPGVTGELFGVRDDRELARRLIALLQSPERRAAMSAAALETAATMRMERSVEQYFRLYDRLLADGDRPATGGAVRAREPSR